MASDKENQNGPDVTQDPPIPPKNPDPSKVCHLDCKHEGKINATARTAGYVSCSFCFYTYHKDCVTYDAELKTAWLCLSCKMHAAEVKSLHCKLDSLLAQNVSLTQVLTQQQTMLNSLNCLEKKVSLLSCKLIPDLEDNSDEEDDDEPEDAEPEGELLIGDSLIRDVLPTDDNLTVECIRGATLSIIKNKLKSINPRRKRYHKVYIIAGTNDASTKRTPDKIAKDCKLVMEAAKRISTEVVLSSIPPRADKKVEETKIDTVNQMFKLLTNDENVRFANNDNNFRFRDNSIDLGLLLPDQLHLSSHGVRKLLANLTLTDKAKAGTAPPKTSNNAWNTKPTQSPNIQNSPPPLMSIQTEYPSQAQLPPVYFRGPTSVFSNFFETPIAIWGINFKSSEHAFQYKKCMIAGNNATATNVLKASTPLNAKRMGDSIATNPRWHDIKQGTMLEILKAKSRQCPRFRQELLQSGDRKLIEDTPDSFWGRGRNGQGLNILGKLLSMLRDELAALPPKHHQSFTPRPTVSPQRNEFGHTAPRTPEEQLRCFNCGEASHTRTTCRHPQPLRCYRCNCLGHKRKFCQQHH